MGFDAGKEFSGQYLKSIDLDGKERIATIVETKKILVGQGRDQSEKPAVVFAEFPGKPMLLNKTNGRLLCKELGRKSDGWIGKHAKLVPTQAAFAGQTYDVIRVAMPTQDELSRKVAAGGNGQGGDGNESDPDEIEF
jgi:hypothetical protein